MQAYGKRGKEKREEVKEGSEIDENQIEANQKIDEETTQIEEIEKKWQESKDLDRISSTGDHSVLNILINDHY